VNGGHGLRLRNLSILLAALCLGGSPALADWSDFAPRPAHNGAYVDIFGSYEHDENPVGGSAFGWSDTFLREKLTLFSDGFIYHPRFLQYGLSLSGALKQEQYQASYLDSPARRNGTGYEYNGRVFLLPEHSSNLELFALRYEPLFKEQATTQRNSLQSNWGGLYRYRSKPWFFNTRYNDSTTESGGFSSNVKRFGVDGEYFRRFDSGNQFSLSGAYNPSRFSSSTDLRGNTSEYIFGNLVDLQRARLTSSLSGNRTDQESGSSGKLENDQLSFYEILNLFLPLNFRSDFSYRVQDNESTLPGAGTSPSGTRSDLNKLFTFDVTQRLFQSLDTTLTYQDSNRDSTGGDSDFTSRAIAINYTKMIPRGRVQFGVNRGRGTTENQGRADIVNERHSGILVEIVGSSFTLYQQYVDPQSIVVFVRNPLTLDLIPLVENVHYLVLASGNTFDIFVSALPPPFVLPATCEFTVTYSLTSGNFRLRADDVSYNASVDLLDALLTPYAAYLAIDSKVLDGVFPGIPLDSTTRTLGLRFRRGPLRAVAEHQTLDWEISPYRAWRGEAQYSGSPGPTLRLYGTLSYLNKHFPEGGTGIDAQDPYTDETLTASGNLQKQIPSQGLVLSAGGSLSQLRGRVDGYAYSVNSSLSWKIGKMDVTAGANAYKSDTEGVTGLHTGRFHEYYYINLRRAFF